MAKNTNLLGWYSQQLTIRPIVTKMITAGAIGFIADGVAQVAVEEKKNLDMQRIGKFVALQTLLIAPLLHYWSASCLAATSNAMAI